MEDMSGRTRTDQLHSVGLKILRLWFMFLTENWRQILLIVRIILISLSLLHLYPEKQLSFSEYILSLSRKHTEERTQRPLNTERDSKDTVNDSASLDVALLAEMQLDKLPKAAGVVVVDCLGVSKGLHDGTAERRSSGIINQVTNTSPLVINLLTTNKVIH